MFRGIQQISLDTKGRLALPTRYRESFSETVPLVATIDTEDPCLLLYPRSEWELIEQKLQALPSFNKTARRIQRLLIGHATELEIDNNFRVLLPQILRDYARLSKRVMLVGQGKKFELWDESVWHEQRNVWLAQATMVEGNLPEELTTLSL